MDVKLVENQVIQTVTGALLRLTFEASGPEGVEVAISATGVLLCSNKILARLSEIPIESGSSARLRTGGPSGSDRSHSTYFWLAADLGPREIDALESLRGVNSKGDVILTARVAITYLVASAERGYLKTDPQQRRHVGPPAYPGSLRDVVPPDSIPVLLDSSSGYLEVKSQNRDLPVHIRGSDWVHDYCPALGVGSFAVFEIPQPEALTATGMAPAAHVNEALSSARKAQQELKAGNWDDVIESLRGVWELLRNQPSIAELLKRDGYSDEATSEFNGALKNLFGLSSKFVHRLDRSGTKIAPEIRPSKEDAYLVFGLALGALNLVSRKYKRLS